MAKLITLILLLSTSLAYGTGRTINYDELTKAFLGTIVAVHACDNSLTEHNGQYRYTGTDKQ